MRSGSIGPSPRSSPRARAELARRQAAAAEEIARLQTEAEAPNTAALGIGAAESELREALRLEELERRTRSLRSLPVAHTSRTPDAATRSSEPAGGAADTDVAVLENTVQAALASFEQSVGALENELEAGLAGDQLLLGSPRASPLRRRPRPGRGPPSERTARLSQGVASPPPTRRAGSGSTRARSSRRCFSRSSRAISPDRCSRPSRSRSIRPTASGS